jgi:hypothetical protein
VKGYVEERIIGNAIAAGYGYDYRGGAQGDVPKTEDPVRTLRGFSTPFPATIDRDATVVVDRTRIPPDWQVQDEHTSVYELLVMNDMSSAAAIRAISNDPFRDKIWNDISLKFVGQCSLGDLIDAFKVA